MTTQRQLLSFLLATIAAVVAHADILIGRIIDSDTKEPIEGANVAILGRSENRMVGNSTLTDSLGQFTANAQMLKTTVTISAIAYYDKVLRIACFEGNDTTNLGDIALSPNQILLKELEVKAQVKRFTLRGDTIVFNPEAFKIEDNEKLEELLKRLPGVKVTDNGSLEWNGRPVRLRMNGNKTLSDGMIGQLPAEAVKEIKGYERDSEYTMRTGNDDGGNEQVLDVVIKEGWLDKWYGNIKAQATLNGYYDSDLNANLLSEDNPFQVWLRAGDFNRMFKPMGIEGMTGDMGSHYRQQMGALQYQHLWDPKFEGWTDRSAWGVAGNFNHYDRRDTSEENSEYYIEGAESTFSTSSTSLYEHTIEAPLSFGGYFNLGKSTTLDLSASAGYTREEKTQDTQGETSEGITPVNTRDIFASSLNEGVKADLDLEFSHYIGKTELNVMASARYSDLDTRSAQNSHYDFTAKGTEPLDQLRTDSGMKRDLTLGAGATAKTGLTKALTIGAGYELSYSSLKEENVATLDNTADYANSFTSLHHAFDNTVSLSATWKLPSGLSVRPKVELSFKHENIDYNRGALDTIATRDFFTASPAMEVQWKIAKAHRLVANVNYTSSLPDILSTLDYRDDSNPLNIIEGNPDLKRVGTLKSSLSYSLAIPRNEQTFTTTLSFTKEYDPVGSVHHYDSTTGGYTSHYENMRGGNSWSASLNHSISLCEKVQLTNDLSFSNNSSYGILTITDAAQERTLSSRRVSMVRYKPEAMWQNNNWRIEVGGDLTVSNNKYNEGSVARFDVYKYKVYSKVRFKTGIFEFQINPQLKGNKGYHSDRLNSDRFLLDAVAKLFLFKKKLTCTLEANDIFNRDISMIGSESVSGRTESFYSSVHNYLAVGITYSFDAK